ncbi:MAG TPA: molybdopterin-dependent oxidoreductase, partial [Paraburkholderia sp.]
AVRSGKIKAVWIACTNPVHSMPDIAKVREALTNAEFVVVQDAFLQTDTVPYADVLLPAATWGEKSGTVTNSERRITRVRAAVEPAGDAKPDWWIANEVARRIAVKLDREPQMFDFASTENVFDEHRTLTEGRDLDIGGISYALLDEAGPQQWPFPAGSSTGDARRYTDGRFATTDGRARFHATPYLPVADPVNARFPFRLTTGRLRDQWHGMSRTGRVGKLFSHAPEPALNMQPTDAARRGLNGGELVRVTSRRGALVLPLQLSDDVQSGAVFAAMHWNGQFLASGGINETMLATVDPHSKQPELKHAAVRIERAELPWRVIAARRGDALAMHAAVQPLLKECAYASVTLDADDLLILRAAHTGAPQGWLERVYAALDLPAGDDTLEYRDARRELDKRVIWRDDVIDGFVLAGDTANGAALLAKLRDGMPWAGPRFAAFATLRVEPAVRDRVVCSCMQVKESRINAAIANGATVPELKAMLGCGTVCGSCVPELKRLCDTAAFAS